MFRHLLTTIFSGTVLCTGLVSGVQAADFSHIAYVPVDANRSTIRFEKARLILVPTGMRATSDARYCAEAAVRDPGGSSFCPSLAPESRVPAWEVTYSYTATAAAWDENGQARSEFAVLYRPEELAPQIQKALAERRRNRSEIAEYFALKTYRETLPKVVVNEAQSSFCDGNFVEGALVNNNSNCVANIALKTVASPSDWVTISVEAAPAVLAASVAAGR
jgi:hypothetical protein